MFTVETNHGTYTVDATTARTAKIQILNEWADVYRDFKILAVTEDIEDAETTQDKAAWFDLN